MNLKANCKPRKSVFEADRRATVLSLDSFLQGKIHGPDFFAENYFTKGMETLVDRAFRHLSGNGAGSSVFLLSQAMGGGKTHSMIGFGLLARDPELRRTVLGENDPAPKLGRCRVVGFNGRNTDARGGIWGSIAEQLGRQDQFARYLSPILSAPGPEAWKQLMGRDPLVIFLDELPPYLQYAVTVPVGAGDLGVVTTAALANLFVAVAEMDNVCLILSDLAGTNFGTGQISLQAAFDKAIKEISSESRRIAVPITPVNPNGDELYHILRKRLFEAVADDATIKTTATGYRDALREAVQMNLTTTTPESMYARVVDSYPFHPDLRELVGKFKENEGFQQTRGVIRLMQMVVANLWNSGKAEHRDLIAPYDIDLNVDEIASEIRAINPTLSEAIAHDIAHGGDSEVEQIDAANGNADASEAARLILVASLSTTPGAIHGLREYQLVDCLQRPGRDLSTFKTNVLDKLNTRAWYLHNSADGRLFFKNQQNLAAKLRSTALSLHSETVDRMLRERLEEHFEPTLKDCYQLVSVLPPPDEVQIDQDRTTLIVVRPGGQANQLPISSDWQAWWAQQQYKNRILFLTGSKDTFQKVLDGARQTRALQSIEDELTGENTPAEDPQWRALDSLRDRIELQFTQALKEAFDQIIYPSINSALRTTGVDLAFVGNRGGEATIRNTLEGAQKFTTKISDDSFRAKAEQRLFGGVDSRVVLWSDFKRNAAVMTGWPLHKPSALEEVREESLRQGKWRQEGNHIRRGPFPPPAPSVEVRVLSVDPDHDGRAYLKIDALHANALTYETGNVDPTPSSSPVPTPAKFEATGLRYRFLAYDQADLTRISPIKEWTAEIKVRHQLHNRGDHFELELRAFPRSNGIVIRYTTDGTAPTGVGAATYDGPIRVPTGSRMICAIGVASEFQISSEVVKVPVPQAGSDAPQVDVRIPARWNCRQKLDDSGSVWEFLKRMEAAGNVTAYDIQLASAGNFQHVEYSGSLDSGYSAESLKATANQLQTLVEGGELRMMVGTLGFPTGQALLDWLKAGNQPFDASKVSQ